MITPVILFKKYLVSNGLVALLARSMGLVEIGQPCIGVISGWRSLWVRGLSNFYQVFPPQAVGYDAAKLVLGRKRHLTVDTFCLVLRVLVTAAACARAGGGRSKSSSCVLQMGARVFRLHTVWVDGGYDGNPFLHARDGYLPMDQSRWCCDPKNARALSCAPLRWVVERT